MTHGELTPGMVGGAQEEPGLPPALNPLSHRHSLQQVLLLGSGIVVMVLLSLLVE